MKTKDVILDFTSLLDVILIILFFFILYSAFNVRESEARAEEARAAYEDRLGALDAEEDRLQAEEDRLNAEWDRLRALDENAVQNQQALLAFNNGYMLSFNLRKEDGSSDWSLTASRKETPDGEEKTVGLILPGDKLPEAILAVFDKAGYAPEDVLIVTFTYNGNVIGTHRLYVEIMKAFQEVQDRRGNVYLTAINISK